MRWCLVLESAPATEAEREREREIEREREREKEREFFIDDEQNRIHCITDTAVRALIGRPRAIYVWNLS